MSNFTLLMIGVAILIVALVLGTPVPYSFGFAVIYMVAVFGYPESTIVPVGFAKMGSMTFLAMPMFILVGSIMERGKIGEAMIGWVEMLVGKLRGGLGIVSVVSSAVFGAICRNPLLHRRHHVPQTAGTGLGGRLCHRPGA